MEQTDLPLFGLDGDDDGNDDGDGDGGVETRLKCPTLKLNLQAS